MALDGNQHVLVTSHHFVNPNSGAFIADYMMQEEYSKNYKVTFLNYSSLKVKDPRFARIIFPFFILGRVILQKFNSNPFTVVHANTSDAALLLLTPLANNLKIITQSHGLESFHSEILALKYTGYHKLIKKLWSDPLLRISLRKPHLVVTINSGEAEWMKVNYPHTRVIRSSVGIEKNAISTFMQKEVNIGTGIYFGRFDLHTKGLDFLIEQVRDLVQRKIIDRFIFAGVAEDGKRFIEKKLNSIIDQITIFPQYNRRELKSILDECHFFVISSRTEGGPIALLEGMSHGVIPISSRIPFAEEILIPKFSNLIFDLNSPNSFEESLKFAKENNLDRTELISIAQSYSWDSVLAKRINDIEKELF